MQVAHDPVAFLSYCTRRVCQHDTRNQWKQFIIFAWNEWFEGAALEPSSTYPYFGYGDALKRCQEELRRNRCKHFDGKEYLDPPLPGSFLWHHPLFPWSKRFNTSVYIQEKFNGIPNKGTNSLNTNNKKPTNHSSLRQKTVKSRVSRAKIVTKNPK